MRKLEWSCIIVSRLRDQVETKLPTFAATNKSTKVKLKEKDVKIKEEKQLVTQFIAVSRPGEDIDIPYFFGNH